MTKTALQSPKQKPNRKKPACNLTLSRDHRRAAEKLQKALRRSSLTSLVETLIENEEKRQIAA